MKKQAQRKIKKAKDTIKAVKIMKERMKPMTYDEIMEQFRTLTPTEREEVGVQLEDITFKGENLVDYCGKEASDKGIMVQMVKSAVRGLPRAMGAFPRPHDYKIMKVDTLIWLEVGREFTRRNIGTQEFIQKEMRKRTPDTTWHSEEMIQFGAKGHFALGVINESDTFYSSRLRDWYCVLINTHNVLMTYWGPNYLTRMAHMWDTDEAVNTQTTTMQTHQQEKHEYTGGHTTYPAPVEDCVECVKIDIKRQTLITEKKAMYDEFHKLYLDTFTKFNPYTGEAYEVGKAPYQGVTKPEETNAKTAKTEKMDKVPKKPTQTTKQK